MIRRIIPFFTFLFIAFVSQFTKADNFFHSTTFVLDNGLTVIAIENHRAPVVTHMVFYKTGSANDPINKTGIAHLLEHLMFKGTKIIPKNNVSSNKINKNVKIKRKLPGTIKIIIDDAKQYAGYAVNGGYALTSENGYVLEMTDKLPDGLLLIKAKDVKTETGKKISLASNLITIILSNRRVCKK